MALTLALVGIVSCLTAATFVAVGWRMRGRRVDAANRGPRDAFVLWWWGFAAYLAGRGALDLAAAAGWTPLPAFVAFRLATGPLLGAAAGGLAHYIVYLWSGRSWRVALTLYYAAAALAYSVSVWLHRPTHVEVTAWSTGVAYEVPFDGPLLALVLASFGLPLVLGSLAYLGLLFRTHDRRLRYRISLVGTSLLLWVTSGYAAEVSGAPVLRFVAIVVLGLATAGAMLAAYFPPATVRHWLDALPATRS